MTNFLLLHQDTLLKYEERARERIAAAGGELRFVILDLSPVTDIDASAVHFLKVSACNCSHFSSPVIAYTPHAWAS